MTKAEKADMASLRAEVASLRGFMNSAMATMDTLTTLCESLQEAVRMATRIGLGANGFAAKCMLGGVDEEEAETVYKQSMTALSQIDAIEN